MGVSSDIIGRPVRELDTPALLVDLDLMEANIARMANTFKEAGIGWRPHVKGVKIPDIAHRMLAAGAIGVTCAKVSEAQVMADAGITDILIANQVVGAPKMARLVALRRLADPIVCVDSMANVRELDAAFRPTGMKLRVLIEVDLGLNRCGVEPGAPVLSLAKEIVACPGLHFVGVTAWEAHTLTMEAGRKELEVEKALARLTASADACRQAGIPVEIVCCGGTGTYWISAYANGVTECQAGGGIFCDRRYVRNFNVPGHPIALTVLATVLSRPTPTRIVTDAGAKAASPVGAEPWPKTIEGVRSVAFHAEHGLIELEAPAETPVVGDTLEFLVGNEDLTVCLHDDLYGVRKGVVEVVWPIAARGKLQ